jgi:hypothetical protein
MRGQPRYPAAAVREGMDPEQAMTLRAPSVFRQGRYQNGNSSVLASRLRLPPPPPLPARNFHQIDIRFDGDPEDGFGTVEEHRMSHAQTGPRILEWPTIWAVLSLVASAAVLTAVIVLPFPHETQMRELCDRAVSALLNSPDLVEVTRAGIIVNQVNCDIPRRLPSQNAP